MNSSTPLVFERVEVTTALMKENDAMGYTSPKSARGGRSKGGLVSSQVLKVGVLIWLCLGLLVAASAKSSGIKEVGHSPTL